MGMSHEDAVRFHRRALHAATRMGFGRDAEELAQEVLLKFGANKGHGQTIDQAVIDVVRQRYGRPGLPGYSRKHALATAHSIFGEDGETTIEPIARDTVGDGIDFQRLAGMFEGRDREIVELVYREGLNQREVADVFGITESRVNQLLTAILARLKTHLTGEWECIEKGMGMSGQIEVRLCECGCGLKFKCLGASPQRFASRECEASVTLGGMTAVLKANAKKLKLKPISETATGTVNTQELAKVLGTSYVNVYNWTKSGKISAIPSEARNKTYDLAEVRAQLEKANASQPRPDELVRVRVDQGKVQVQEAPKFKVEPSPQPVATVMKTVASGVFESAKRAAFLSYRRALKQALAGARERKDVEGELQLLRHVVDLKRSDFEHALAGLAA